MVWRSIQKILFMLLENKRVLSRITPRLLTFNATGVVSWAIESEQILYIESVDFKPIMSSVQLFYIYRS